MLATSNGFVKKAAPPDTSLIGLRSLVTTGVRIGRGKLMANDRNDGAENQLEGLGDQVKGRVRNVVGGMTGDTSEQLKGKAEELKGKAQRKIGEAQSDAERNDV